MHPFLFFKFEQRPLVFSWPLHKEGSIERPMEARVPLENEKSTATSAAFWENESTNEISHACKFFAFFLFSFSFQEGIGSGTVEVPYSPP